MRPMPHRCRAPARLGRVIKDNGNGVDATNMSRFKFGAAARGRDLRLRVLFRRRRHLQQADAGSRRRRRTRRRNRKSAARSRRRQFTYGIFDLIAGLRYDTYKLDGTFTAKRQSAGTDPGHTTCDKSDEPPQSEGHARGQVTAVAAALHHLLGSVPRADHQRDDDRRHRIRVAPASFCAQSVPEARGSEGLGVRRQHPQDGLFTRATASASRPTTSRWMSRTTSRRCFTGERHRLFLQCARHVPGAGRRGGGHVRRRQRLCGAELHLHQHQPAHPAQRRSARRAICPSMSRRRRADCASSNRS